MPARAPVFPAVILTILLLITSARAQDPAPAYPNRLPISATVGGGVSLGAYQAGFLYYMTEAVKANASAADLRLVSGASAGTINALLTVLAACTRAEPGPEKNLFWDIWSDVGFDRLFIPSAQNATAALSNRALVEVAEKLRGRWNEGISPNCDVVFAVAATRVADTAGSSRGSLSAPRLEEKLVLRIKGRGPGVPPEIHNYPDPTSPVAQPLLALPRDQDTQVGTETAYERLKEVLLASAAFPLAFPPVPLHICTLPPGAKPPEGGLDECGSKARAIEFMDGGVYDNTPLLLAYRTARRLVPGGERWAWRDDAAPPGAAPPSDLVFALIDKDNAGFPESPEEDDDGSAGLPRSLLGYLGVFAGGFVATAMGKEVSVLDEQAPGLAAKVVSSVRHYPTASGHLANFFGFFDRELRRFDFYLGMYDASRMAAGRIGALLRSRKNAPVTPPAAAYAPAFMCMKAAYDPAPMPPGICEGRGMAPLRALIQVSLDRLYSACEQAKDDAAARATTHPLCRAAMRLKPGEDRRVVPGVPGARGAAWRKQRGESNLSHMMRLLVLYKLPFRDLDLDGDHADAAMSKIRHRLGRMLEALSVKQAFGQRALLSVAGKIGLNFLHYAPPFGIINVSLGRGYEVGASLIAARFTDSTSLRWSMAVEGKGLGSTLDAASDHGPLALSWAPLAGPELEMYGGAIVQARVALRGGYQISTRGWGTPAAMTRSSAAASGLVFQAVPSITLMERLRVHAAVEAIVPSRFPDRVSWDLLFGLGWQFLTPFY